MLYSVNSDTWPQHQMMQRLEICISDLHLYCAVKGWLPELKDASSFKKKNVLCSFSKII